MRASRTYDSVVRSRWPVTGLLAALLLVSRSAVAEANPDESPVRPAVVGHRGARARMPENTLPAFRYALESGVDGIELDVQVTADGRLAVIHDATLSPAHITDAGGRAIRPGIAVRTLTFDALRRYDAGRLENRSFPRQTTVPGARIPSLDEVLDLLEAPEPPAARRTTLFLEAKSSADPSLSPHPGPYAALVVGLLRRRGFLGRTVLMSFDEGLLAAVSRLEPGLALCLLLDERADWVKRAAGVGASWVGPRHTLVTDEAAEEVGKAGLHLLAWSVNDEDDQDRLTRLGAAAIVTDDPGPLVLRQGERRVRP